MSTFVERMQAEHTALTDNITKLQTFLAEPVGQGLTSVEHLLLEEQAAAMLNYARILAKRIRLYTV